MVMLYDMTLSDFDNVTPTGLLQWRVNSSIVSANIKKDKVLQQQFRCWNNDFDETTPEVLIWQDVPEVAA